MESKRTGGHEVRKVDSGTAGDQALPLSPRNPAAVPALLAGGTLGGHRADEFSGSGELPWQPR